MRCSDVTRELSAPTGAFDPGTLAGHLASCPRCASWADRNAQLDRIWEATRPAELSDAAWDRIWAKASAALDRPAAPARPAPVVLRPWRRRAMTAFVLAEAAAILLGFAVLLRTTTAGRRPLPGGAAVAARAVPVTPDQVEVAPGEVPLYSIDKGTIRDLAQNESPYAVDPFLSMLNTFESIAPNDAVASLQ